MNDNENFFDDEKFLNGELDNSAIKPHLPFNQEISELPTNATSSDRYRRNKPECNCEDMAFRDYGQGMMLKVVKARLSWIDAQSVCAMLGGWLAKPKDMAKLITIQNAVKANLPVGRTSDDSVWIGGHDFEKEGTFVWNDPTPVLKSLFTYPGEPNNFPNSCQGLDQNAALQDRGKTIQKVYLNRGENCLALAGSRGLSLNDDCCGRNYQFVCQYIPVAQQPAPH